MLVTGATGSVGRWLVRSLLCKGANISALVRPRSTVQDAALNECALVESDLGDATTLRRIIEQRAPQTVFHLAAQSRAGAALEDPVNTLEVNVRGTWALLDACRQSHAPQIILASSDKAYGSNKHLPSVETLPLNGRLPYDVSKSCADLIAHMYQATYGLPVCIVRCGNIFGGGDLNFDRIIPGVIRETYYGRPFVIRSTGVSIRDYLYVEDAVNAFLMTAEGLEHDASLAGEAFNFSLGVRLSALDIAAKVLRLMQRDDLRPIVQNAGYYEQHDQHMLSLKAKDRLSWKPQFDMETGLKRTVAWYQNFFSTVAENSDFDGASLSREVLTHENHGLSRRSSL